MINPNDIHHQSLLGVILQGLNIQGAKVKPILENNVLKIELDENQVKEIAFKDLNPQQRSVMDIKLREGKMVIYIKLF